MIAAETDSPGELLEGEFLLKVIGEHLAGKTHRAPLAPRSKMPGLGPAVVGEQSRHGLHQRPLQRHPALALNQAAVQQIERSAQRRIANHHADAFESTAAPVADLLDQSLQKGKVEKNHPIGDRPAGGRPAGMHLPRVEQADFAGSGKAFAVAQTVASPLVHQPQSVATLVEVSGEDVSAAQYLVRLELRERRIVPVVNR
jgi:hypothetical protein